MPEKDLDSTSRPKIHPATDVEMIPDPKDTGEDNLPPGYWEAFRRHIMNTVEKE